MARGGINKAIVLEARRALFARGENPSIDAVCIELGNTGSKTTIHRYLKEIEDFDPRPRASRERLSDELTELVAALLERMTEEGGEATVTAPVSSLAMVKQPDTSLTTSKSAWSASTYRSQYRSPIIALVAGNARCLAICMPTARMPFVSIASVKRSLSAGRLREFGNSGGS